jgi:hypothetical protein
LFGPDADRIAASAEFQAALHASQEEESPWQVIPVVTRTDTQDWGASTAAFVSALTEQQPIAVIALDRNTAHLAEQLSLKNFLPVVALSSDHALTSTNIPWIFRLPPDTTPATAMRVIRKAVQQSGVDPFRLRDVLASGAEINGIAFLPGGEPRSQ